MNPENTLDNPPDLIKPNNTLDSRENLEFSEFAFSLNPDHIPTKDLFTNQNKRKAFNIMF